ncbi:hypothetical protein BT67DRAFT_92068 [Trichocladium antarcticum]|uniref:Secreted protein n=1 Tax=Trichocladium antarcticum TaxID=1450529 RepID=A0AAN6UFQ7_9PEZI|nr:hypothetical protein BT67DRAFT_92068 [Trichocladium antarcticum]
MGWLVLVAVLIVVVMVGVVGGDARGGSGRVSRSYIACNSDVTSSVVADSLLALLNLYVVQCRTTWRRYQSRPRVSAMPNVFKHCSGPKAEGG